MMILCLPPHPHSHSHYSPLLPSSQTHRHTSTTHTDMHMWLMGFHNKWLFILQPAARKSMVPDLLSFVYAGALNEISADHLRLPIYWLTAEDTYSPSQLRQIWSGLKSLVVSGFSLLCWSSDSENDSIFWLSVSRAASSCFPKGQRSPPG